MLSVDITYSMTDILCDVINFCDQAKQKIYTVYKHLDSCFALRRIKCISSNRNLKPENRKKWKSKKFHMNFNLKNDLRMEFIVYYNKVMFI